ncbi:MAG: ABC transporter permease [Bacteroidota bacterium]|nr:ABC transporter permease [Bacteroidota bacterium]
MSRFFAIVLTSFRMALSELWKNKLRTFLSLFGITIGIFCIISVLATVGSLEHNLQSEIKSLGTNTIYIDKWEYGGGPDYPFWKYIKRPVPKYEELAEIKTRTATAKYAAFKISVLTKVEGGNNVAERIRIYGISDDFTNIQPLEIMYGRFLADAEFSEGGPSVVVGFSLAENLFGGAEQAVNKSVVIKGQQNKIIGIIKKQGSQLIGGWGFDEAVLMPYKYARTIMDERKADPLIIVQGRDKINSKVLKDDLKGTMRAIRKLAPNDDDNFALNDVNDFSDVMSKAFVSVNFGGWIIGALSFIVGIFGVANIMFVTVKERTTQIGLKKAIGAKSNVILTEFLLESAFLCLIGGIIGLLLVFALTKIATAAFDFPIFLSPAIIGIAIAICIAAGITAGIIPAVKAAKMNPVVAIRS